MWRLFLVLLTATAYAQPVVHTPEVYTQCKEVPTPAGFLPPFGEQIVYCKQGGAGWCSMNNVGVESCTGGGGGGGGTVTSVTAGVGLSASPVNPIVGAGTINLQTPVAIGNGGTNGATKTAAFDNLSPLTTKGDLIAFNGTDDVRLGVGADALCLVADSTQATGLKWASCSAGAGTVTSISQGTGMSFSVNPITSTGTINLATPVAVTNGGTGNSSIAADEFFVGTGVNTVGVTSALANCNGVSNFVQYSNGTHNFTCNSNIQTTFDKINSGTNVSATMFVGTGASILPTGSGVIQATTMPTSGLTGTITNSQLHDTYSGVGTCTNQFPRTLNGDAAPTCATVNLTSDVTGILPHGNGGTDQSVATANNFLLGNGTNWIESIIPQTQGPLHYAPSFPIGFQEVNNVLWASDNVDCTGKTDSTSGWSALVSQINTNPKFGTSTIYIPSGCIIRFKSPGANNAAGSLPNNTHIICDDETAGFSIQRQICSGGTYSGAACNTSADCLGGGTCINDFNSTTSNPCGSTTCFAPTVGNTYTVLRDTGVGANDIWIENCSFFLGQASPYQTCSVGGTPCRQECDNATVAPNFPGQRCETNADCTSGTCLRVADCHTGGGTCGGVNAAKVPSGPGQIRAIDAPNTTRMQLKHVQVFDGLTADYIVKTGPNALIQNTDITRELTDCTTPLPGTPSNSACFGAGTTAGTCCYGAGYAANGISSGNKFNTQPANAAVQGLVVGPNSQVIAFSRARGTTAFTGSGTATRFDETVVVPFQIGGTSDNLGPGGLSTNGWSVGDHGQVTKSFALDLCGSGTGINLTAGDSGVVGDKLVLQSACGANGTGVLSQGADNHIIGMNIKGVNGSGTGITLQGAPSVAVSNTAISDSYIEGNAPTGIAIYANAASGSLLGLSITGNSIVSNPFDTLQTGIKTNGVAPADIEAMANTFERLNGPALWLTSSFGQPSNILFQGNVTTYANGVPGQMTSAYHPCWVQDDNATQVSIFGNQVVFGWRGVCGTSTGGLTNMQVGNNRFLQLAGAPIAVGGAGVNVVGNYFNNGQQQNGGFSTFTCDASCAGGSPVSRGLICFQDTDCTSNGNTCNAAVHACLPEPLVGFIGSPTVVQTDAHPSFVGNLMFQPGGTSRQCTAGAGTVTNPGQFCQINFTTCSGDTGFTSCSGSPTPTCHSTGAQNGKACCAGTGNNTCAIRDPQPMIRVVDYGAASGAADFIFMGNQVFSTNAATDWVGIDMQSSASLGNISLTNSKIADNIFDSSSTTDTTAIRFPTSGTFSNVSVTNNHFDGFTTPATTGNIANYKGTMGSLTLENGRMASGSFQSSTLNATQTIFFPVNGVALGAPAANTTVKDVFVDNGTFWKSTCTCDASCTANSTRVFTLEQNGGATSETCTITCPGTTCTTNGIAPLAFTAGQSLDWKMVQTIGTGTLAVANCTCTSYLSHDNAM